MTRTVSRPLRWVLALAVLAGLLAALFLAARYAATRLLRDEVLAALGPDSEVGEVRVGWSAIELHGLRIKAPAGKGAWPAADQLRAGRVTVVPSVKDLLSAKVRVHEVRIEDAYLSVLRTRDGKLALLPGLLKRKPSGAAPQVVIDAVRLTGGSIDFFDASVRQPAHRLQLDKLQAELRSLSVPDLGGRTELQLDGNVRGVRRHGTLAVRGWLEPAARHSDLTTTLRGVDLIAFQPYLIKASETGVRRGTLDLDLRSTVRANRLHAPGKVTLSDLELTASGGPFGTFMGMPRQAVLRALKDRDNRITMRFTLEGDLSDPRFSLNESLALRTGAAAAELLGISLESVSRGVGSAAQGIGDALRKTFGR
jgi:hypothetical protein